MDFTFALKKLNFQYLQFCLDAHLKAMQSSNKPEWLLYHFEQALKLKEKIKRNNIRVQQQVNLKAAEEILSSYKTIIPGFAKKQAT